MKRLKRLTPYQKVVLVFMLVVVVAFAVLYAKTGFEYQNRLFVPSQENGTTVYTGKLRGQPASFIVSADKTVEFHYGDRTYGPYAVREDPAAIPEEDKGTVGMIGVALYRGDELLFRGGALYHDDSYLLFAEDGTMDGDELNVYFDLTLNDGTVIAGNGKTVDPVEPSAATILKLIYHPTLSHRGDVEIWFLAVLICVLNAVSILFADELFRFDLALRIRHADRAEPTELELAARYIGWAVFALLALGLLIAGIVL